MEIVRCWSDFLKTYYQFLISGDLKRFNDRYLRLDNEGATKVNHLNNKLLPMLGIVLDALNQYLLSTCSVRTCATHE